MDINIKHTGIGTKSTAVFSDCGRYRYILTREWDRDCILKKLMFIMLNPSTADEFVNDPTVHRCQERAMKMGYGGLIVCNIFAYKATDPKRLRDCLDPIGASNDMYILKGADQAGMIICAWGGHGDMWSRGEQVRRLLLQTQRPLYCLGMNKNGSPKHPLYLPYKQPLMDFA